MVGNLWLKLAWASRLGVHFMEEQGPSPFQNTGSSLPSSRIMARGGEGVEELGKGCGEVAEVTIRVGAEMASGTRIGMGTGFLVVLMAAGSLLVLLLFAVLEVVDVSDVFCWGLDEAALSSVAVAGGESLGFGFKAGSLRSI